MRHSSNYIALSLLAAAFAGCSSSGPGTTSTSSDNGVDPLTGELAKYNAAIVPLANACTWDSTSGKMTVSLVAGELAMVSVRKVDKAMLVNGNTCADTAAALTGAALTTKVKTIAIGPKVAGGLNGGTQTVILDNRNGTFALAAATSGGIAIDLGTGASNEVAVVGSTAADKYGCIKVTGKDTLGLKTATSSDVTMVNPVSKYTIDLNDGDDSFDQGDCPTAMSITG